MPLTEVELFHKREHKHEIRSRKFKTRPGFLACSYSAENEPSECPAPPVVVNPKPKLPVIFRAKFVNFFQPIWSRKV